MLEVRTAGRYNICEQPFAFLRLNPGRNLMPKDTKEKILTAALEMFAQNGYAATNIRELQASLGMGKSSMYRHYESKDEVWNAVIDRMEAYYEEKFGSSANLPPIPESTEELRELTLKMLGFTMHDEKIILVRKILLTEQFHDERVRKEATKHFNEGLENMFAEIFSRMMEKGVLRADDPRMLAFSFTAPISTLVQLCDREPEREEEIMEKIRAFINYFIKTCERTLS